MYESYVHTYITTEAETCQSYIVGASSSLSSLQFQRCNDMEPSRSATEGEDAIPQKSQLWSRYQLYVEELLRIRSRPIENSSSSSSQSIESSGSCNSSNSADSESDSSSSSSSSSSSKTQMRYICSDDGKGVSIPVRMGRELHIRNANAELRVCYLTFSEICGDTSYTGSIRDGTIFYYHHSRIGSCKVHSSTYTSFNFSVCE